MKCADNSKQDKKVNSEVTELLNDKLGEIGRYNEMRFNMNTRG